MECTVSPRISDPFYVVTNNIKLGTTSWTDGTLYGDEIILYLKKLEAENPISQIKGICVKTF